jgi:hypothetical protein
MSATKAVFVLIHGGWHSHSAWDRVTPSQPAILSKILIDICVPSLAEQSAEAP